MDGNLLHLATPVAVGQAAGQRASLSWKKIYCQLTRAVEGMMLTCEVVEPPTRPCPPPSADRVVTAAFMTPYVASGGTPGESS